jgi:hypothetical protein
LYEICHGSSFGLTLATYIVIASTGTINDAASAKKQVMGGNH